jgi:hypothetical protein
MRQRAADCCWWCGRVHVRDAPVTVICIWEAPLILAWSGVIPPGMPQKALQCRPPSLPAQAARTSTTPHYYFWHVGLCLFFLVASRFIWWSPPALGTVPISRNVHILSTTADRKLNCASYLLCG